MDYNKPWGWQPQKVAAPMGNTVAPLAASAPSMPDNVQLQQPLGYRAVKDAGQAVAMKALDNAMAPAKDIGSIAQDSATKAALFSDAGYGAATDAAADAGADVATDAAADVATDAATDVATDAAAEAASSGVSAALPFAGTLKSLAEGNYVAAGAQAAGTAVAGQLGGLVAKYGTKLLTGYADGTTGVPAPLSGADRAAARMAAGARFAPELFGAVNAPAAGRATIPATPSPAAGLAVGGGKDAAMARPIAAATQPKKSIVQPVVAPTPATNPFFQMPWRNPMYDNAEVGGA